MIITLKLISKAAWTRCITVSIRFQSERGSIPRSAQLADSDGLIRTYGSEFDIAAIIDFRVRAISLKGSNETKLCSGNIDGVLLLKQIIAHLSVPL